MPISARLANLLSESFLSGPWTREGLLARAGSLFVQDRPRPWLESLVDRVLIAFPATSPRPIERKLLDVVRATRILKKERIEGSMRLVRQAPVWPLVMRPPQGPPSTWSVPAIVSAGELADWFSLGPGELEWFANRSRWSEDSEKSRLSHYRYRWIAKPSGGLRLLESPKPRLKRMQRRILDEILNCVPLIRDFASICKGDWRTGRVSVRKE